MLPIDIESVITPQLVEQTALGSRYRLDVPVGLEQGRAVWGGIATGGIVRAAQMAFGDAEYRVRSLALHLVSTLLPGTSEITLGVVRRGSSTLTVSATLVGPNAETVAVGTLVLAPGRSGDGMPDGWLGLEPPPQLADGWQGASPIDLGPPMAPTFTSHLEFRLLGPIPYSGGEALALSWLRPRTPCPNPDEALIAALADASWPATIIRLDRPRPMGTLSFALELTADPATLPRDETGSIAPLLHRGRLVAAREGFCTETRELWSADGRLVAFNTQSLVIIK